jgi:hypothetical protein
MKIQRKAMNITSIERNLRFYGPPGILLLIGMAGLLLIDPSGKGASGLSLIALPFSQFLFYGAGVITMFGLLWLGYRAWLEWRWERGELDGGCMKCGGVVKHHDGRYGAYSKCMMCGAKRKG